MTIHTIYQIIGLKVNVYQFFSTILKNYKNLKAYANQITQQVPRGVDNIIKGYVNYYQINKIYEDFDNHLNQHFEKWFKTKKDQNTIRYIIQFLEKRFRIFDDFIENGTRENDPDSDDDQEMLEFIFEAVNEILSQDYTLDQLIFEKETYSILYHEVPHDVDDGYVIIGCIINAIEVFGHRGFPDSKISFKNCTFSIEETFKIKNLLKEKLKNLGFDGDIELYMIPDFCKCCS